MVAQNQDICGLIQSTTQYHLVITNNTDHIVDTIREKVSSKSAKCNQFIAFSVCFYSFRDCDRSDGSQLLICEDKCPLIISLYQECVNITVLKILKDNAKDNDTLEFLEFATTFNCLSPETYTIPDVHVNATRCATLPFLDSLTTGKGYYFIPYFMFSSPLPTFSLSLFTDENQGNVTNVNASSVIMNFTSFLLLIYFTCLASMTIQLILSHHYVYSIGTLVCVMFKEN